MPEHWQYPYASLPTQLHSLLHPVPMCPQCGLNHAPHCLNSPAHHEDKKPTLVDLIATLTARVEELSKELKALREKVGI